MTNKIQFYLLIVSIIPQVPPPKPPYQHSDIHGRGQHLLRCLRAAFAKWPKSLSRREFRELFTHNIEKHCSRCVTDEIMFVCEDLLRCPFRSLHRLWICLPDIWTALPALFLFLSCISRIWEFLCFLLLLCNTFVRQVVRCSTFPNSKYKQALIPVCPVYLYINEENSGKCHVCDETSQSVDKFSAYIHVEIAVRKETEENEVQYKI